MFKFKLNFVNLNYFIWMGTSETLLYSTDTRPCELTTRQRRARDEARLEYPPEYRERDAPPDVGRRHPSPPSNYPTAIQGVPLDW